MNDAATSLDRLHDIVESPPVSWWPLAPGWYVLAALAALLLGWLALSQYNKWQTNAYRRAALRELAAASSPAAVSEILRRTALSIVSRDTLASLTGDRWTDWLTTNSPQPMPAQAQRQLSEGVYNVAGGEENLADLQGYAANWIRRHQLPKETSS